jgi:AcrR family transcriptional regulator
VIEKATEAFAERGYTGTSMREIAMAIGMTQQGLSHHFPSKSALLEAVLEHRDQSGVELYSSLELSVVDTLRAIVRDVAANPALIRLTMTLSAEAISPSHPAHTFFREHFAGARSVFQKLLRRGQLSGEVRDDLPAEELAVLAVAVFEGLQLQWLTGPDVDIEASLETLIRVVAPAGSGRKKAAGRTRPSAPRT